MIDFQLVASEIQMRELTQSLLSSFSVLLLLFCRAVALGLTTDDVMAIEEFTETLKKKRSPYDVSQLKKDAETDELKSRVCIY